MGINYSSSCFYGVELDMTDEEYDEFDVHRTEFVQLDMVGNLMSGPMSVVAYYIPSYVEGGREGPFGLFQLGYLPAEYIMEGRLVEVCRDNNLKIKSGPSWFFENSVS